MSRELRKRSPVTGLANVKCSVISLGIIDFILFFILCLSDFMFDLYSW